jgi:hypothetical protein
MDLHGSRRWSLARPQIEMEGCGHARGSLDQSTPSQDGRPGGRTLGWEVGGDTPGWGLVAASEGGGSGGAPGWVPGGGARGWGSVAARCGRKGRGPAGHYGRKC